MFRLLIHSKPQHIQNSRLSRYRESLKYSLYRTLHNLDIFTTLVYSSPRIKSLSNIYFWGFYSSPCATLAYLNPLHIQHPIHIYNYNSVKHLSWNILFKILCTLHIFRTLVYSPLWYIPKLNHIQSPARCLRWNILSRTLCDYSIFKRPIYSKLLLIQSLSLSLSVSFKTTNCFIAVSSTLY